MNWILIVLVILIVLIIMKFKEFRHKFGFLAIALIALFLVWSVWHVYIENKVSLGNLEGVVGAAKIYFSWLGSLFGNFAKVSTYAVKQDWGINVTNFTG